MKIKLIQMVIKNFKGIKELILNFGDLSTIRGENGTGKSTVFDAFTYVMFGKDSHDRSDFEIQPLDSNNNVIHGLDTSVTLVLEVDGREKVFKRTLKERWVKPNGKAEKELKGCTTDYEIDEIPVKQKEYQAAISQMIDENIFKMVTNPLYFSSLNWTKQREILMNIIGDISEENVINYNKDLEPLKALLTDGIDNFNKRTKASIAKLKEEVKSIPARIDECNNNIKIIDVESLESKKKAIQSSINSIDEQIADSSKANEEKLKFQDELFKTKEELSKKRVEAHKNAIQPFMAIQEKINETRTKVQEVSFNIKSFDATRNRTLDYIKALEKDLETQKSKKQDKLAEYHTIEDRVFEFDTLQTSCPHCGREYDSDKILQIKADAEKRFNKQKQSQLDEIVSHGKVLKSDIEKLEEKIKISGDEIAELNKNIANLYAEKSDLDYQLEQLEKEKEPLTITEVVKVEGEDELKTKITDLQAQIEQFKSNDNIELKKQKKVLQEELEGINIALGKKDVNEDLKRRMEELNQEEKQLQIKIAELEGQLFLGEEFIRTKVELLESSINKKFKGIVAFKLFENQVNGGLKETCEALIDGVPFGNANTASKINAGLSIINVLCEHYQVSAPVFIDNAESVNEIGYTDSQLIKLVVSLNKELNAEVA